MTGNIKQPEPELLEREERVIELRKTGATWEMVGKALGYAGGSGAYKAYQRAAERRVFPLIDEYREIELALLDSLLFQLFHDDEGKPKKRLSLREMDRALAIHDRKARLLGLNAPEKIQAEVITYDDSSIAESHRRFMELLATTQQAQGELGSPPSETGTTA
jgi:hypothetical protein